MKSHFATLFSVLVYTLKNNYLIYVYLFIPLLMNSYQNISFIAPIIFIPISLVLILLLPKKIGEINYSGILNRSYIAKYSYYIVQFLLMILNIVLVCYTIREMFFYEENIILFIASALLITIYISTSKTEVIFNSSSFMLLVAIILIIVPVFLANEVKDFTLLMPLNNFEGYSFLLIFYLIFDAISIVLSGTKMNKKINKWQLAIPIITMLIFMSLELVNLIIITGDRYLMDNEYLGFFTIFIQDTINYIGNLGLIFLYVIPVVGCYKSGYCLRRLKDGFNIKDSLFINILLFIILFFIVSLIIYFVDIPIFSTTVIFISTIMLFIVYVFIILNRSLNYEIKF